MKQRQAKSEITEQEIARDTAKEHVKRSPINEAFHRFSRGTAAVLGSPWAFIVAVLTVVVWAMTGPHYQYSQTWQLIINTGTTIVTFLMVFLIQNTQNRDAKAIHLKLDELIASLEGPRNKLVDLEEASEEEIEKTAKELKKIRHEGGTRAATGLDCDDEEDSKTDDKNHPESNGRRKARA